MRSQFASLRVLTLPFGAIAGTRIVIDGIAGNIQFYNAANELIGYLSPDRWYTGLDGGAHAQLDPFGGLRIFDIDGELAVVLDATGGLQIRDPVSGNVVTQLTTDGLHIDDPTGALDIDLLNGASGNYPTPRWKANVSGVIPGPNMNSPAIVQATPSDLEIRYTAAWTNGAIGNQTFTPPAGYTERLDTSDNTLTSTLAVTAATRQPAVSNAVRTFVCTSGIFQFQTSHVVVVRGDSVLPPSYNDIRQAFHTSLLPTVDLSMAAPNTAVGHMLVAFVTLCQDGSDAIPQSWSVPEGWQPLGYNFFTAAGSIEATGAWWKIATADDIGATYDVTVNLGTPLTVTKKFSTTIIDIADPAQVGLGPDIRIGNKSLARGLVLPRFESILNNGPHGTAITDMNVTVPMIAGRGYDLLARTYVEHTNSTPTFFQWRIAVDGTDVGLVDHYAILNANDLQQLIGRGGPVPYYPTTSGDKLVDLRVTRIAGASAVTLVGGATFPRRLEVRDIGGDY